MRVRVLFAWALVLPVGQELEVKLIRDRHRGIVAGYGFIDFRNHETAQLVLDSLNGKPIGETKDKERRMKLKDRKCRML